jgi:hypothetical protein
MHFIPVNIVEHLFHQSSLNNVAVEEIEAIAHKHPSFGLSQFLLLQKMKDTDHPQFEKQLHKTALYFHQPQWLSFLLTSSTPTHLPTDPPTLEKVEETIATNETIDSVVLAEEILPSENQSLNAKTAVFEEAEEVLEEEDAEVLPLTDEGIASLSLKDELKQLAAEIQRNQKETVANAIPAAADNIPVVTNPLPLAFEPYHTIDYFASQGIKTEPIEPVLSDTFGQQLKSFTEWVKSMKRLPSHISEESVGIDNASNNRVLQDAANSLQEKEILTETMAEVYAQQGLREKALQVYEKLSLQNPHKNHYFATKIATLKP